MAATFQLDGNNLTLDAVRRLLSADAPDLSLADDAKAKVEAAARFVRELVDRQETVYGVTTGFGRLADVRIATADLARLQEKLVISHAAGVGRPLPLHEARLAIAVRAATFASGHTGIRLETLEALLALWNRRVTPLIPAQGSVCASGDLAPLAHIALVLLGMGEAYYEDRRVDSAHQLDEAPLIEGRSLFGRQHRDIP